MSNNSGCVIPIDLHDHHGVKCLQSSLVVCFGPTQARFCQLNHWKDSELWDYMRGAFPLPHPSTVPIEGDIVRKCCYDVCDKSGLRPCSATLSVYSVKFLDSPISWFCSLDCCLEWESRISETKLTRLLKPIKERHASLGTQK